jgi:hypothetical protein
MKKEDLNKGAVCVIIAGKPVLLDLENLKDEELCMHSSDGSFETKDGEQHFSHYKALPAAEKQGKRLLTNEENYFIHKLPWRWDAKKKGRWLTFDLIDGGTKEVFFPAAGYRNSSSGSLYNVGTIGLYWSASPYSSTSTDASLLYFDSGTVNVDYSTHRAHGLSVRCVRDIN